MSGSSISRRQFVRGGVIGAGAVAFGGSFWRALAAHTAPIPGPSPYGPLGNPDALGFRLPPGFRIRLIARSADLVPGTSYVWPFAPDGAAVFALEGGGWVYSANSEVGGRGGGASSIVFDASGKVVGAHKILERTNTNCAGGPTPWGTWLSCEEEEMGQVWECDPLGRVPAIARPAMGMFTHEAAVVDPVTRHVYLTEDRSDGGFYRFRPERTADVPGVLPMPILETGTLEIAKVDGVDVEWVPVPVPFVAGFEGNSFTTPTRHQVPGSAAFRRGEGAWFDVKARRVYFCTTTDNTIWSYDPDASTIERLYDGERTDGNPLRGADNIVAAPWGDILVCEDPPSGTNLEIIVVGADGVVFPLLEGVGALHKGSEFTGIAFDPSGTRMYFNSQRAYGAGATYELTGPFARA